MLNTKYEIENFIHIPLETVINLHCPNNTQIIYNLAQATNETVHYERIYSMAVLFQSGGPWKTYNGKLVVCGDSDFSGGVYGYRLFIHEINKLYYPETVGELRKFFSIEKGSIEYGKFLLSFFESDSTKNLLEKESIKYEMGHNGNYCVFVPYNDDREYVTQKLSFLFPNGKMYGCWFSINSNDAIIEKIKKEYNM